MSSTLRKALMGFGWLVLAAVAPPAFAQPVLVQTPPIAMRQPLSDSDSAALTSVLNAARTGNAGQIRAAMSSIADPTARRIATWALADAAPQAMSFIEIDGARRDLAGWPRGNARQQAAEKALETSGMGPAQIVTWFGGAPPSTPEGAMAQASALRATGHASAAAEVIRTIWRGKLFDADVQRTMLARFGDVLTIEDHTRRLDALLYGPQGPAARDMLSLVPADIRALGEARIALRTNAGNAMSLAAALPASVAADPGLTFEKVAYYRRRNQNDAAIALLGGMPVTLPHEDAAARMWRERYPLVLYALRNRDSRGAYAAAANSGLTVGGDAADAEFYAGWIALTRLNNPTLADQHFARLQQIGSSPITQGRALYWRGRAAEAAHDPVNAQLYFSQAARFPTAFYGQLAAARLGNTPISLGRDPDITAADRARFEGREVIRAARILAEIRATDTFHALILGVDDLLPSAAEEALLVDLTRQYGDQTYSMKVVRAAATRGFILPERGYPVRRIPGGVSSPEPALILGITRQESGFDPVIRSPAGAVGMMQLMPGTASLVARRIGVSGGSLSDPDYNTQLGAAYLDQMISNFSGSYVMAIAAYNAGPGRPTEWSGFCGDPRATTNDPIDFIECIPFAETRNYVMRVMEGMQVYRARLNGGSVQVGLQNDLRRGSYAYGAAPLGPPNSYGAPTSAPGSYGRTSAPSGSITPTQPQTSYPPTPSTGYAAPK